MNNIPSFRPAPERLECRIHRHLEDHLAYRAASNERCMCILGEEDAEVIRRHRHVRGRCIVEEADIFFHAVFTHRIQTICQRFPAHRLITLQYQLNVDVTPMCFQLRHLLCLRGHLLHDGDQVFTHDVVTPRCECEEISIADVVERALEQRVQCGVAKGLGEGGEDHIVNCEGLY